MLGPPNNGLGIKKFRGFKAMAGLVGRPGAKLHRRRGIFLYFERFLKKIAEIALF